MRAMSLLLILAGSAAAWAAPRTGNELVLFRMILRKDMEADVQAAADSADPAAMIRVQPLEAALADLPRVHDFYALLADKTKNTPTKFHAARALAYFGDRSSIEFLLDLVRGAYRGYSGATERSQAGVCLLYLGCDLPADFAFSQLTPPVHAELDAFLGEPAQSVSFLSPYTSEQLQAAVALYLGADYPVSVRGPLPIVTVEQETLAAVLHGIAEYGYVHIVRTPFGNQVYEWEEFKDQILPDDLVYHFRSADAAWQVQGGLEGYVLVREGQVVAMILPTISQLQDPHLLVFDDFDGRLGFGWDILNPDPSRWSLSSVPGALTITTQTGTFTRNRQDHRNVFLMNCPAAPGQDFQVTTCLVSFAPVSPWNQAGLLLWNDPDNYLKLVYEYGHVSLRCQYTSGVEVGGGFSYTWYSAEQYPARVWLRIARRGGLCELSSSIDGEVFMPLIPQSGSGDHRVWWGDAQVAYVGLFAENGSATDAPSVDASFDFFEVRSLPIVEE